MDERSENSGGHRDDDSISYNSSERINHHNSDGEVRIRPSSVEEDHRDWGRSRKLRLICSRIPGRLRKVTLKIDRLSMLPDSVISHILSFLPIQEAVKTSVLSRRWPYLWTSVPNLCFSITNYNGRQRSNFFNFVNRALMFHKSDLKKLVFEFIYNVSHNSCLTAWLRFGTRANVEELCLNLYGRTMRVDAFDRYILPQHLYTNSKLKKLSLTACDLVPQAGSIISWKALKSLSIGYTSLSNDVIQKVLATSPLLDNLELHNIKGFNCLDFRNSNLKKLVLREYWDPKNDREDVSESENIDIVGVEDDDAKLEIIAPKLRSLSILGCMRKFKLSNVQMVEDCTLNFDQFTDEEYEEDHIKLRVDMLREVLHILNHATKLTLGHQCMEVLSHMEEKKGVSLPASPRKCLILQTHIYIDDLPGIASLLRNSPSLETIHIDMTSLEYEQPNEIFIDEDFFENCKFTMSRLKTVRIIGLVGRQCEYKHVIPLTKFLLKNATVLEKMIISARKVDDRRQHSENTPQELLEVALKLLSFPRSSLQAVIEFSK